MIYQDLLPSAIDSVLTWKDLPDDSFGAAVQAQAIALAGVSIEEALCEQG